MELTENELHQKAINFTGGGTDGVTTDFDLRQFIRDRMQNIPPELQKSDPGSPRGRILEAARQLFAEQGFQGTSIREIAKLADVNIAMVHYYFSTKELLYKRVFAQEILSLFSSVQNQLLETAIPPNELILLFPICLQRALSTNVVWQMLLRREIADGGKLFIQLIREMGLFGPQGFIQLAETAYNYSVSQGKLPQLPFRSVMRFLVSSSYGLILLSDIFNEVTAENLSDPQVFEEQLKVSRYILQNGLMSKAENGL